ncbi:MAG: hypothetical protein OSB62_00860 [Alphaproteobacteria bacterium]|nr:hypothetical protein [Alphaproteobacteria bacterium]
MKTLQTLAATATIYLVIGAALFFAPVWAKEGLWFTGMCLTTFLLAFMVILHENTEGIAPVLGATFLLTANLPMSFMGGWDINLNEAMSVMLVCFLLSGGLFVAFMHQMAFKLMHGFDPFCATDCRREKCRARRARRVNRRAIYG